MAANIGDIETKLIRDLIYDGNISKRMNAGQLADKVNYKAILNAVFKPEAFETEEKIMPGIKNLITKLKNLDGSQGENYLRTTSFSELVKNYATRIYNNKCWMKIFGTMAIILTAVTLLIQPFFGKIDKEYPEEKKGGNR